MEIEFHRTVQQDGVRVSASKLLRRFKTQLHEALCWPAVEHTYTFVVTCLGSRVPPGSRQLAPWYGLHVNSLGSSASAANVSVTGRGHHRWCRRGFCRRLARDDASSHSLRTLSAWPTRSTVEACCAARHCRDTPSRRWRHLRMATDAQTHDSDEARCAPSSGAAPPRPSAFSQVSRLRPVPSRYHL